jgi:hypothetical protein
LENLGLGEFGTWRIWDLENLGLGLKQWYVM